MKKKLVSCQGITIIELLVSVTIIILLSGLSLAGYFRFDRRQTMINDARNFATVLRRVQAMAKNLVYPTGCDTLKMYSLIPDGTECETCQTVSATAVCGNGSYTVISNEKILTKAFFSLGTFANFEAGTGKLLNASELKFRLKYDDESYIIEVKVDQNGIISTTETGYE